MMDVGAMPALCSAPCTVQDAWWRQDDGEVSSTLNPIIYVMTNQEFKAAFTAIVYRLLCCRHHAPARQHGSCRDNETVDFTR